MEANNSHWEIWKQIRQNVYRWSWEFHYTPDYSPEANDKKDPDVPSIRDRVVSRYEDRFYRRWEVDEEERAIDASAE
jgi:transposase